MTAETWFMVRRESGVFFEYFIHPLAISHSQKMWVNRHHGGQFGTKLMAEAFAKAYGGKVVRVTLRRKS